MYAGSQQTLAVFLASAPREALLPFPYRFLKE